MSETRSRSEPSAPLVPRAAWVCLALLVGTWLLFSRAIRHDFLDLDDPDYVTANVHVQAGLSAANVRWAFTATAAGNWHPLTWLSHMLDWQLFGSNPHGHHAVNVFWHSVNAVLAFLTLRRLTGAFWTSAFSAALFAWHPLRVESVAWVAERKDVLSTFFGLLALWAYATYAQNARRQGHLAASSYWGALLFFALGLLCKPMLVSLPLLLLLLDWWPLRRMPGARAEVPGAAGPPGPRPVVLLLEKVPFFLLSGLSCAVTYLCQKKSGAVVETLAIHDRLANAVLSAAGYLEKFFWPFDLAIGYPRPARWLPIELALAAGLLVVLTAAALWQRRRRPWLGTGWLWFLGMLVPVIGLVPVGLQGMADRYTYLPILGFQLALLWTVRERQFQILWLAPVAAAVLLAGCAARTWNQLGYWQNSYTLYTHSLAVTKDNYLAHCYLATTLFNDHQLEEASVHLQRAIELKPDYIAARLHLGLTLEKLDRDRDALAAYTELLKLRPDDAPAEFRCANVLARLGRDEEAVGHYEKATQIKPDFAQAEASHADSLRALNRPDEACVHYRRALALQPDNAYAYYGLGVALDDSGHGDEALVNYRRAVGLDPEFLEAQYNLGALLLSQDQAVEAIAHFQAAIKVKADFAAAYAGMGLAEAELNRTDAAIRDLEHARRLDPNVGGVSEALARLRESASGKP